MAKKLVNEKGVEALVIGETFYMDGSIILTPGAKDVLRDKGVTIVYGPRPETCESEACESEICKPDMCAKDRIEATVAGLLEREYGITDEDQVKALSAIVADMIQQNA